MSTGRGRWRSRGQRTSLQICINIGLCRVIYTHTCHTYGHRTSEDIASVKREKDTVHVHRKW